MIDATKLAAEGVPTYELMGNFQILVSYTVVVTVVSLFLFKFVWED
jgi:hypothetical protein